MFHALISPLYADPVMLREQRLESLEQDLRQKALRRLEAIDSVAGEPLAIRLRQASRA